MSQPVSRRQMIRSSTAALAGPACIGEAAFAWAADEKQPVDLLLTGATLIDGSGTKRTKGDVAIRDGRFSKLGPTDRLPAKQTLDARGLIVSPGFIDIHTHSDRTLLRDGAAHSAVRQGATTHVIGNCGENSRRKLQNVVADSTDKWLMSVSQPKKHAPHGCPGRVV